MRITVASGRVIHPEVRRNLVEPGMIKDVAVQDIRITVALPFVEIPIWKYLSSDWHRTESRHLPVMRVHQGLGPNQVMQTVL